MVRETRHLWVGNLPENIREERIREHFKRYGRVQSVKLLPRGSKEGSGPGGAGSVGSGGVAGGGASGAAAEGTLACTIAFMDIKSAAKAHTAEHKLEERTLTTEYYEPAAIPSAAAPQTPAAAAGPYTTTAAANARFPNSHGSSEEHTGFTERFYERGSGRVADPEYLRRPGYHDTSRGRARDRLYRNGPYPSAIIDRSHRSALGSSWPYEGTSARYAPGQAPDAAYVSAAPVPEPPERRPSADVPVTKKKTKSRSGSRTPSPSGSTSSRSASRSRSRSSSSSSSSSTSRGSSSPTSSPRARARVQSAVSAAPPVHSEDRRPLAIIVRNLPARSSDTSLKDGLFHEYKKHGKVTWVKVVGQSSDRYALVCFKKPDDVDKALEVSYDKSFFGCKIEVGPYQGYDVEDNEFRPYEAELDEYHPKATRTLFIGNLEKDVTASDLRKHFDQFGEIIEIDIKKQGAVSSYAFCQYSDIVSVVKAIRKMDGEHLGNNRIKLGFGKSMPTPCVWVDGVSERVDEKYLTLQFERYGQVTQVSIDRDRGHALIFFEQLSCAQTAVKEMRGVTLRGKKLQVDFASRECQDTFFDHLEKQGAGSERPAFDATRDAVPRERSFESSTLATTNRYTRYDTPSRPRTSSYSSRSGTGSQCTGSSAVPSPGTPGSVTPRGSGSRSRLTRFNEYYEAGVEYPERRFRSYDEFSQGSGASHEDVYEHEYIYNRESPGHVEPVEPRTMQSVVVTTEIQAPGTTFVPPDIRHLQKERVHLLEQLDECPSSGDELMSPKKRLKLDICDGGTVVGEVDVNHGDHRKVIEVRRLSDPTLKHHSRRPSIDGKHCLREVQVERSYMPHAVCKRRKTSGSESDRSRIHHHHDMSGSESLAGSRPGTPLCDERPENLPPSEPRRLPRERNANEGPLSLPLPRFAAQVLNSPRLNISVAGFKGSKENIVSSPPAAVTSPKVANPIPPSPVHVPPPASPPPRPPSSSNSSDSDAAPPSPTLEERLRSLDEKYEKWSGSRALSAAGGDALAKLDASASERFRFRHKLLDLDLKELQPSEIVKSVLAKRSVFDEDSKRLENVGEKYEPRDFTAFPRAFVPLQSNAGCATGGVNTPPVVSAPPLLSPATSGPKGLSGTALSPRSLASSIPAAKGLQYPFPSHPPVVSPVAGGTASAPSPARVTGNVHSDNTRLKLCPSLPSDRTNSKVNLNRSGCAAAPPSSVVSGAAVASTVSKHKNLDKNGDSDKINSNIPINSCENASVNVSSSATTVACSPANSSSDAVTNHVGKTPPRDKSTSRKEDRSSDKVSKGDKVVGRRDSVSSSPSSANSSKCDRKDRRDKKSDKDNDTNGDYRTGKAKDNDTECDRKREKESEYCDRKLEEEKQRAERAEKERQEMERKEREERERLEKERQELEKQEKERLEKEKEKLEKERQEKEKQERLEKERLERERKKEKEERERREREERERREREERERREREERERREREERERREKEEQLERERIEKEKQRERERRDREEKERREHEELEKERQEKELHERQMKEKQEHRKREKEIEKHERRHKEDNHESKEKKKDKEDYDKQKQRENHSDNSIDTKTRHRENHIDVPKVNDRHRDNHDNRKENKDHEFRIKDSHDNMRNNHEMQRKDSHDKSKDHHDNSRSNSDRRDEKHSHCNDVRKDEGSKNRHHIEREDSKDRRKDSIKEIRETNNHEKNRHFSTDSRDNNKDRHSSTDSRHTSTDSEKNRQYNDHGLNSTPNRTDVSKRKDKVNSAPASVGCKRRISSQDSSESPDDSKRIKVNVEHRKISDRRDSKDSRDSNASRSSSDKIKQNKHNKSNFTRMLEDKIREEKRNKELSDEKRREKEREREREDRYKLKQQQKMEKQKIKSKNRDSRDSKDSPGTPKSSNKELILDKDFLARLDLRANEDEEKQKLQRKDSKEKRKQENHDLEERRSSDDSKRSDDRKKDKIISAEKKNRDENNIKNSEDKNKNPQRKEPQRIRKQTNSSDTSDSDEPKKHSIFDIVDDEPAYISMYDKVKARSCKNMQKQEEEKRQEKLKAKFTQLKQSRAKREEKKRSTSWDEDSDSDHMDSGNQDNQEEHTANKQNRRGNKMLITSSSEDELHSIPKSRKKPEMYTDSDSDRIRIEKHERLIDSSDDETARNKSVSRKGSKSRITSDTSEDEQPRKRVEKIKKERYSDSEVDQGFADSDERTDMKHYKKPKEEKLNHYDDEKYIKKEKKSSIKITSMSDDDTTRKMLTDAVKAEIFCEKDEIKIENSKCIDRLAMLCDISSEGENMHNIDNKKDLFGEEKSEIRKKHKKKQKRQKNSLLTEDTIKLERMLDEVENDSGNRGDESLEKKMSEKKKHGSKKDKKRDKVKDEERIKDKSKKLKKLNKELCSKGDLHNVIKRDGKLEDIFGSFSDDSETGNKDSLLNSIGNKENSFFVHLTDKLQSSHTYASDSDGVQQVDPEKEKLKEESRKRKEKKRKEKERRLREENENSVDFADLGKVLEDNLKDEPMSDEIEKPVKPIKIEIEEEQKIEENHNSDDIFNFIDGEESQEIEKKEVEKKELKEKKKKRKKSKEEKQNRHHHHHEKNQEKVEKIKSPDLIKKEPPTLIIEGVKEEPDVKPAQQSPSLPNLLDIPSPPQSKPPSNSDFQISPLPREPLISPIPKTPTSSKVEKKREKFIPGFGSEIDEKIHENAVKSISDFGSPTITERIEQEEIKSVDVPKVEKSEVIEDKPRVVISQEETEDAVAALLGESFGGGDFSCYNESQPSPTTAETNAETTSDEVTLVEDDEEMRQAVQSLNVADMEAKPDTPQSETDLQIDTDTDDGEEIVMRYEQSPRTPDMVDLSRPPKTPDFPTGYYRPPEDASKIQPPILIKTSTDNNITQIKSTKPKEDKPISDSIKEVKRNIEVQIDKPVIQSPVPRKIEPTPPVSSVSSRTVISQSWTIPMQQKQQEKIVVSEPIKEEKIVEIRKQEQPKIVTQHKEEPKPQPHIPVTQKSLPTVPTSLSLTPLQPSTQSVVTTPTTTVLTSQSKPYLAPPVIKISDHTSHSNIICPKLEQSLSPIKTYNNMNIITTISTTIPPALTTVMSKQRTMPQIPATKPVRIQHAVISHLNAPSSKPHNPPVMTQSGGLLTTVVTSTHVQPNRLPIQSIMASKPIQPTTMILPQSKIAVSTIQKIVSSPEVSKPLEPSRMIYHSTGNMTIPSYSYPHTLTHPQPIPTSVQVPLRTAPPPIGLLAPVRHILPPTAYGLPPTTRSISPLVKEPVKSVIEKTMPVISELQKPAPISMPAHIYSQPSFSQPPTSLHMVNTDMKPSTPVIKEVQTPKLVPILTTNEVRIPQHSIIQQAPPQKPMPTVQEIIRHSPVSQSVVSQAPQSQPPMIVVSKPVSTVSHSTICHPVISHVVMSQPMILQPTVSHSVVSQPVTSHTVMPQCVVSQPHIIVSQSLIPKPIVSQPIMSQPIAATPIISHTSSPKPVISHSAAPTLTNLITDVTVKPPIEIRAPIPAPQDIINEIPKVIKETLSRSTPSPVIVSTPKEHVSPAPPPLQEQIKIKKEEPVEKEVPSQNINILKPENNVHLKKETKSEENLTVVKDENKIELQKPKLEISEPDVKPLEIKQQPEPTEAISVIKEVDHYEKEKQEDTESVISEPKESLTSELCMKDDPLDSKEDSDYWSAKEVNIESVIKKVDALCSADELSENSETGKDEWYENENKMAEPETKLGAPTEKEQTKSEECDHSDVTKRDVENLNESTDNNSEEKELAVRNSRRGGRMRGRKNNKSDRLGVTTRRGKSATTASRRGGRGGRTRNDKKIKQSESDVYEFHDDSDESKDRPRLILTIKSPAGAGNTPSTPSAVIKETAQKPPEPPREEFVSPAANTRKSRRIQERDGSRNTVDDVIEDVVRNAAVVTRSAAAAAQGLPSPRRSTRQNVMKLPPVVEPRKSPRATRRKDRRVSENTDDSSEEKSIKKEEPKPEPEPVKEEPVVKEVNKVTPKQEKEKVKIENHPPLGLKANLIRRLKSEEPMTLIDPVTGLLTQMRECEEGKYIPVSTSASSVITGTITSLALDPKPKVPEICRLPTSTVTSSHAPIEQVPTTVIAKSQPANPVLQKPQSLKAHVLSSQAAKVVVNQTVQIPKTATVQIPKTATVQTMPKTAKVQTITQPQQQQPNFIAKQNIPVSQHLNINVSVAPTMDPTNLSPRQSTTKPIHVFPQAMKNVTPAPMSPNQMGLINNPKQHFLQATKQQHLPPKPSNPINPKTHLLNAVQSQNIVSGSPSVVNATLTHMKSAHLPQSASLPSPVKQQVVGNVAPIVKQQNLHVPQQILTGAVASPPLKHHIAQQPIVIGASNGRMAIPSSSPMPAISAKGAMDPQKVEVSMAGCVMISHPTVSPQAQARGQVLQAGMPVPAYEASLHGVGDHPLFSRQSPPPAHQQTSPAPQGEPMPHFPPGAMPLRTPHDLPHHFMHSHHQVYQYLRAQQEARIPYHLPRSPMVGGLEKTKDGQEGEEAPVTSPPLELRRPESVGLTPRPTAVPHSLQSPHDRATDSPQVAQVYMHQARIPHYHTPGRYYESPTEPPPAHRPVTSHTALTGPGPSLGAGGNLTGAMARHAAAEAPASQRGMQVATPPHASQVPPQADSLLMLLKQYRIMWQGLLALKNDQAAVQMHFVFGNPHVARNSLPCNSDGSTPPLRIAQRMRLEKTQVEGVARKMQMENEHCVLLALPCGRDHMDVLQQSTNLSNGFITYLQQKEAAGIVNIAAPGSQHAAYVVHIFPSCDFVKENLARIAPNLLHRVADIAHLLIVIATV